jgi:hypothetical protein
MAFAQIGPFTTVLEAVAAAIDLVLRYSGMK